MNNINIIKYNHIPYNRQLIFKYAHTNHTEQISTLIDSCIDELQDILTYKVCYREFDVNVYDEYINLNDIEYHSKDLSKNMKACNKCIIFAATIGLELDRLIHKYSSISPSRALIIQAIGTERIESLCNTFNDEITFYYKNKNMTIKPRFSPGYGDLSIEIQKDFFRWLNCYKHIGLTLNDSLLMSPTKSVTAIIGLKDA